MIKIDKNTAGSSVVKIPVPFKLKDRTPVYPNGYEFPICKLIKVDFDPEKEIKSAEGIVKKPIIIFTFRDGKNREFVSREFPIEDTDADKDVKTERLTNRIKHIWDVTLGDDKLSTMKGENFKEFFKSVADAFKSHVTVTNDNKKVFEFSTYPLYIKLTYFNSKVGFPLFPNFLQRAVDTNNKKIPCDTLEIDPAYDKLEINSTNRSNSLGNDFGGEDNYTMDDDFPIV